MPVNELASTDLVDIYLIPWGIKFATAIAIFVIGRWIAKLLLNISKRIMHKAGLDEMLIHFLGNIIYSLMLAVVVLATLEQLGVTTTSAIAILGAAGLAVGLALQSSLSNFASGVMLIIFRPFNVGNFVEAGGTSGTVERINIFNTIMKTPDNREIIIPNNQIYSGTIINYSARSTRRIDLVIGIGYQDDMKKARDLMMEVIKNDNRILNDPEPAIMVAELADNSVNFNVRPWVNSSDFGAVRSDLLENIKNTFDANGISIPYPQRDVHLHQVS